MYFVTLHYCYSYKNVYLFQIESEIYIKGLGALMTSKYTDH